MQKEEIKNKLMEVIDENLPNIDSEKVDVIADFVEEYDINSIQLIQLIVAAEEKFDVSFDDRELALNKYNSFDDKIQNISVTITVDLSLCHQGGNDIWTFLQRRASRHNISE